MLPRRLVLSCTASVALDFARTVGLDVDRLIRNAGIRTASLSNPDARIPFAQLVALWAAIAEDPRTEGAMLRCLHATRLTHLGSLGYVFRHAETVKHALMLLRRYSRMLGEPLTPEIRVGGGRLSVSCRWPAGLGRNRPFVDGGFAQMLGILGEIIGERPTPVEIRCQFSRGDDADERSRAFGCRVLYDCGESTIAFPDSLADRPVVNRDPALFAIVERYTQGMVDAPVDIGSLAADVRAVIRSELADGEPPIARIAQKLGMGPRTLQRRLSDEDLTLSALVNEVRRDLSLQYLDDATLGLSDIAFMLGYADTTSFQRAFRRWTGQAPASYRGRRKRESLNP